MTISGSPHPWFSAYWGLWVLSTFPVIAVTVIPGGAWYGLFWWALWAGAFLVAEIPAALIDTRMRDTLSQVATLVHRKLAKADSVMWDRGWTAMVTAIAVIVSFASALPWLVVGVMVGVPLGLALGVLGLAQWYLVTRWLYDHWVLTEVFG